MSARSRRREKKRSLPKDLVESTTNASKRRKTVQSMMTNISKIVDNDGFSDTVFIVGTGDNTQEMHGIAALFAAQSNVLKNMIFFVNGKVNKINLKTTQNHIKLNYTCNIYQISLQYFSWKHFYYLILFYCRF